MSVSHCFNFFCSNSNVTVILRTKKPLRQGEKSRIPGGREHRFVFNYVYEFPTFLDNSPVWSRIVGGWQLSGITQYFTGTPFSVLTSTNPLGILPGAVSTINLSQRAIYNPSGVPMTGTAATQPNPMFIAPQNNTGVIGMGANVLRVGNTANFDAALSKSVRTFGENQSLQFRWEVFNALNHRNFSTNPSNTVSTATNNTLFLNLGQTNVRGRSFVFAVRYLF